MVSGEFAGARYQSAAWDKLAKTQEGLASWSSMRLCKHARRVIHTVHMVTNTVHR